MKKMLYKIVVTFIILVTFFSIDLNVFAANFNYSDFDWNEFLEQNKNYWISSCDEGDEKCYDRILKTQEQFYTKLYKLLAQYEKKGIVIKDSIIYLNTNNERLHGFRFFCKRKRRKSCYGFYGICW